MSEFHLRLPENLFADDHDSTRVGNGSRRRQSGEEEIWDFKSVNIYSVQVYNSSICPLCI